MFASLDYEIWRIFNFYNEGFWIPMIIPITLFVIGSIALYYRETNNAKKEERRKKKFFIVLFVIGLVVGVIEVFALEQALFISILIPPFFLSIVIPSVIFAIISVVLFIRESIKAKREARPRSKFIFELFVLGILILGIVLRVIRLLFAYRGMFKYLFILFDILAVVCIVLFIIDSIKAKRESRPRKDYLTILFILALMILFINVHILGY